MISHLTVEWASPSLHPLDSLLPQPKQGNARRSSAPDFLMTYVVVSIVTPLWSNGALHCRPAQKQCERRGEERSFDDAEGWTTPHCVGGDERARRGLDSVRALTRTDSITSFLTFSSNRCESLTPYTTNMRLDTAGDPQAIPDGGSIRFPVLKLISEARAEHGMRQHDYERYR